MPNYNKTKKIEQGAGLGLGRALVKSKNKSRRKYTSKEQEQAFEVTAARIADPKVAVASGLQSIIEQDDVSRLLTAADLANREFVAEKLTPEILLTQYSCHAQIVDGQDGNSAKPVLTAEELKNFTERLVCVPRRPNWADGLCDNADEFQAAEMLAFHDWLARLSMFETDTGIALTPFERNIEVWRQLWRVLERSHVVIQIVDSRNPLLFRCADLDRYVKEFGDGKKSTILLLNKADLLSQEQRRIWHEYFKLNGIHALFYSAIAKDETLKSINEGGNSAGNDAPSGATQAHANDDVHSIVSSDDRAIYKDPGLMHGKSKFDAIAPAEGAEGDEGEESDEEQSAEPAKQTVTQPIEKQEIKAEEKLPVEAKDDEELAKHVPHHEFHDEAEKSPERNPWDILDSEELLTELEGFCEKNYGGTLLKTQKYVVGLCGFPNVGKSSTLNSLVGSKKVAVSATPGRTKHFQTIHLTDQLILCDSPGLVMPTLAKSNAELVINGVLPIDQIREPLQPIELIYEHIDHAVLENMYGVSLPPSFGATEFLQSIAFQRGFMSSSGRPDHARASRIVLRHYTSGKLLYCTPPPADFIDPAKFLSVALKCCFVEHPSSSKRQLGNRIFQRRTGINIDGLEASLDREFFGDAHVVGVRNGRPDQSSAESKPWKKHFNGNKREKLRRRFVHLEA